MKSIIRIPTEQYAYIEVQFEGTEQEIISKHAELTSLYKNSGLGLSAKEFNSALDIYLATSNIEEETYHKMSIEQQKVIQELKKAFKRADKQNENMLKDYMEDKDRAFEHKFHKEYDDKCSECFKGRNDYKLSSKK